MAAFDELLANIPIADIAAQTGLDEATTAAAITQILPSLVGGMKNNADSGGATALAGALADHSERGVSSLADIDPEDGKKIVRHVFGGKEEEVTAQLAGNTPNTLVSASSLKVLLPIVAPLVLGAIGKQIFGGQSEDEPAKTTKKKKAEEASGGLGDILGSVLGGLGSGSAGSSSSGGILGGLGGMLGGIFGGK